MSPLIARTGAILKRKPAAASAAAHRQRDGRTDRSRQGYEVDKGVYLRVEDEEIDAIAIEGSHTIDIDSFLPKAQIDERYVESPYYLIPENKVALEAFAVIRDAIRGKSIIAIGRVVLSELSPLRAANLSCT